MTRDPRYDILLEPVRIGPLTTRNRFYQVPHCNGMGHAYPSSMARMRGIKAEGGWSVVCTEEVEIHHTAEHSPFIEGRLWDDSDIPTLARMCDEIHKHGSLAGFQPAYNGFGAANLYSREIPMAPSARPVDEYHPIQARAMDKADIREFRRLHRDAVLRARRAGFDIIYVYCAHDLTLQMHFLSRRHNKRTDEYGGSLENRVRLYREILQETKEAVGDTCAVATRFAVDELLGSEGISCQNEGRDVVEMLADLPDLWDVNVSDWINDSTTSRFFEQGNQEPYTAFVKKVTGKPVVAVGRYTSPDAMVSLVERGHVDLIGAARPSIADPFLPKKIEEGRIDEIRECIGCNICVTGDYLATPLRCTQNPTMAEEWRKGWHPEYIPEKKSDDSVLVVGAGPAGLECTRALGQRGYTVALAEARTEVGGRVAEESRLPGLSEWIRVRDYRQVTIAKMTNVETYLDSRMTADQVREFGAAHVVLATGCRWDSSGMGRTHRDPIPGWDKANVFTPDDVIAGAELKGPVVVFDDDHYYMGGIVAEKLRRDGLEVALVTPAASASEWTFNTMELGRIQTRLLELGIEIVANRNLVAVGDGEVELACVYTDRRETRRSASVVMVTARLAEDGLYHQLVANQAGIASLTRIGDCLAPGTIAAAVYGGHRYARELDQPPADGVPFRRELIRLAED